MLQDSEGPEHDVAPGDFVCSTQVDRHVLEDITYDMRRNETTPHRDVLGDVHFSKVGRRERHGGSDCAAEQGAEVAELGRLCPSRDGYQLANLMFERARINLTSQSVWYAQINCTRVWTNIEGLGCEAPRCIWSGGGVGKGKAVGRQELVGRHEGEGKCVVRKAQDAATRYNQPATVAKVVVQHVNVLRVNISVPHHHKLVLVQLIEQRRRDHAAPKLLREDPPRAGHVAEGVRRLGLSEPIDGIEQKPFCSVMRVECRRVGEEQRACDNENTPLTAPPRRDNDTAARVRYHRDDTRVHAHQAPNDGGFLTAGRLCRR